MGVTEVLHAELARHRSLGMSFDRAWAISLPSALKSSCDPADWRGVFECTRTAWQASYEGQSSRYTDRALGVIGRDLNGNALEYADVDDPVRVCPQCKRRLPKHKKDIAKYCSDKCRRQAHASVPPPQISPVPGAAEGRYVGPELVA
jgi:hypothetical protein